MPGTLFVVATPLGNLEDLSPRALATLRAVACVACEDTRRTGRLLRRHDIATPLFSCHKFNERERIETVLDRLRAGEDVALVSDGGTPAISDPGSQLVRAALDAGHVVSPIPGPSAPAALLSAGGLPADRFVFDGFLPARGGERRRRLREIRNERRTVVLFEAPHRIHASLRDIAGLFGDREIVLGRELTKIHETILRGTADEVRSALDENVKGEIVLAVAGATGLESETGTDAATGRIVAEWNQALAAAGGDRRAALKAAARKLEMSRPELHRRLAEIDGLED